MKPHFLLIFFVTAIVAINQNSQQSKTPLENICGSAEDRKCISGGVLNGKVVSVNLPVYPPKAQENQIEGTVIVELLFNGDGEVISAKPFIWSRGIMGCIYQGRSNHAFSPYEVVRKADKGEGRTSCQFWER